jgi:hypothetical protein
LADKEEDRFTQFLCQLLQSPEVLRVFLAEACHVEVDDVADLIVATQTTIPDGRPDLVIAGPRHYFLFEAKVGSWMHDDQLVPYAKHVKAWVAEHQDGQGRLFLLAPAVSVPGLVDDARAQLGDPIEGIPWEAIALLFDQLSRQVHDNDLQVHLATFVDLVRYRLGEGDSPFTGEEIDVLRDALTARALHRAYLVLERVAAMLKRQSRQPLSLTLSSSSKWQGYTIRTDERWWWFGVWLEVWAGLGRSPLILQLPGLTNVQTFSPALPLQPRAYRTADTSSGFAAALELAQAEDPDRAATRLSSLILSVLRVVPETGGTHPPP